MKLRLYVSKRNDMRDYSHSSFIRFAVVDLDKSQNYPSNFVCMLPRQISEKSKQSNVFASVFGNHNLELAKCLLIEALATEDDSEIKAEIEKRLKMLEPPPTLKAKCRVCGESFEPKRLGRFKQKICQECRRKKNASQT